MSFTDVLDRLTRLENPYPGLRPFDVEDSHLFFGRDRHTAELAELLDRHRFVAVVGVSGSGKSSLVRAGLIPALHHGQMRSGRSAWRVVITQPGSSPFARLEQKMAEAGLGVGSLRRSSQELVHAAQHVGPDENLLLVVDQFEELFRYRETDPRTPEAIKRQARAAAEAADFVQLLLAATQQHAPVFVVCTMRSDYLGDCAEFCNLPETLNRCTYLIPRLTRQERKDAIERPLGRAGIAPQLVQRLLNDAGDAPEELPVLQHALMRTWHRWNEKCQQAGGERRAISEDDYNAIGGYRDALNNHADELLRQLDEPTVATLFKRLTARGRSNRERRDPAPLSELWALCEANTEADRLRVTKVVDRLRSRDTTFLSPLRDTLKADTDIDITHESLIRLWRKLRDEWVPQEQKAAKTLLDLAERAAVWKNDPRRELLRGLDLSDAERWNADRNQTETWAAHYADATTLGDVVGYLDASTAAEAERLRRQEWDVWKARGTAAVFFVLMWVAAWWWLRESIARSDAEELQSQAQSTAADLEVTQANLKLQITAVQDKEEFARRAAQEAIEERRRAEAANRFAQAARNEVTQWQDAGLARQLVAQSYVALDEQQSDLALLLAAEALQREPSTNADRALRTAIARVPPTLASVPFPDNHYVLDVAFSPDGRLLAAGTDEGLLKMVAADDGAEEWQITYGNDEVTSVLFGPDGAWLVALHESAADILDTRTGNLLRRVAEDGLAVAHAAVSSSGVIAIAANEDEDKLFFVPGPVGGMVELTLPSRPSAMIFTPDGQRLLVGEADGVVRSVSVRRENGARLVADPPRTIVSLPQAGGSVTALAAIRDATRLAVGTAGALYVADTATGKEIWSAPYPDGVTSIDVSPDGRWVAAGSDDGSARVHDAATGTQIAVVVHDDDVRSVAFGPNGLVASGSDDGTARLFEAQGGRELFRRRYEDWVRTVAFSPDGGRVAVGTDVALAQVIGVPEGRAVSAIEMGPRLKLSPDGQRIVRYRAGAGIEVVSTASGRVEGSLAVSGEPADLEVSNNGRWVLVEHDAALRVYEVSTGKVASTVDGLTTYRLAMFSGNGQVIVLVQGSTAYAVDVATGRTLARYEDVTTDTVAVSDNGLFWAAGLADAAVVFSTRSSREVQRFTLGSEVVSVALSVDGTWLATAIAGREGSRSESRTRGTEARVRVFNVHSRAETPINQAGEHRLLTLAPDGRELAAVVGNSGRVYETSRGMEAARLQFPGEQMLALRFDGQSLVGVSASASSSGIQLTSSRQTRRAADLLPDACRRIQRPSPNFTAEEWRRFAGPDVPYDGTCASAARSR